MSETYEEIVDRKVPWKLYGSRLISSWGDRMWSFAVGLFMIELSPGSLKWPAVYGLALSLSVVFCGPAIGRWVDRNQRWRGNSNSKSEHSERLKLIKNHLMDSGSNIFNCSQFFCGSVCSLRHLDILLPYTT